MFPLFNLLSAIIDIILIVLTIRFFAEQYSFYGFGPFLQTISVVTEPFCKPFRKILTARDRDYSPLLAIISIIIIRGLILSLFALHGPKALLLGQLYTWREAYSLFGKIILVVMFIRLTTTGYGLGFYNSLPIKMVYEGAAYAYGHISSWARTNNMLTLFILGLIELCLGYGVISLIYLNISNIIMPFPVVQAWHKFIIYPLLSVNIGLQLPIEALGTIVFFIFIRAILSWFSVDPFNPAVQLLEAITSPFVEFARKICPWARLGMIDFSPMIAVFGLWILQSLLSRLVQSYILVQLVARLLTIQGGSQVF